MSSSRTEVAAGPTDADGERIQLADLSTLYRRETFVLVGCGADKRDPEDPTDRHLATVGPDETVGIGPGGERGPAWRAEDLYTSTYFALKRQLAEAVTTWAPGPMEEHGPAWAVLSAEHGVVYPFQDLTPYDTTIEDLGDDPTNEAHWCATGQRLPSGRAVVTELDSWADRVYWKLRSWVRHTFRERSIDPYDYRSRTLLVLAGQRYIEPLREREVFAHLGDFGHDGVPDLPITVRFLFEEIDAEGIGEQMAWLSEAVDRLDTPEDEPREQANLSGWS